MATNTHTIHGEKVRFGMQALANVLIQSADLNLAKEVKEYTNEIGSTVSLVEYKHRLEASISAVMLQTTTAEAVAETVAAWVAEQATSATFGLAAGGTAVLTEFKISEQNEEAATVSISATYYPNVVSSAA